MNYFLSICIPTYNGGENLKYNVNKLIKMQPEYGFEISFRTTHQMMELKNLCVVLKVSINLLNIIEIKKILDLHIILIL